MKISGWKKGQATLTIPSDIMKLKGWDDGTDLYFTPFVQNPNEKFTKDTPIILKEIEGHENESKKKEVKR
jgi:hypothetical protein